MKKESLFVYIQNSISGNLLVVKKDWHTITLEATKENWRWIESEANKLGIPLNLPDGFYESWPESGVISHSDAIKIKKSA